MNTIEIIHFKSRLLKICISNHHIQPVCQTFYTNIKSLFFTVHLAVATNTTLLLWQKLIYNKY
jgi:hypothetical protein